MNSTSLASGEENITEEANYKTTGGDSKTKSPHEAISTIGHKTGLKDYNSSTNVKEDVEKRNSAPKRLG